MLRTLPIRVGVGLRMVGPLAGTDAVIAGPTFERLAEIGGDIALDMTGVTRLDTMGLTRLLVLAAELRGRGRLTLIGVRPCFLPLFEQVNARGLSRHLFLVAS